MIDKSFYHGQQGECFKKLDKHFEEIRHEFFSQSNKIFLSPEDFSNSVRGEPQDYTDEDFFYKSVRNFNSSTHLFDPSVLRKVFSGSDYQKKWYLSNLASWHLTRSKID